MSKSGNCVNYQVIENEINVGKCPIFYIQIHFNSKILILICPLTSEEKYVDIPKMNYNINHLLCSRTRLGNNLILQILSSFGVVEDLNQNTQTVLQFIQKSPGCHMRQIQRDLNMAMGTIQYHLSSLEEMGKIISERADSHRFYFPVGTFGDLERNILKILNQDSARDILLFIIEQKSPTQTDITNNIKISSGTANWHLMRLLEYGIISEEREGKFKKYHLNGNPGIVINLLKNYHTSKWNSWSNKLAELFLSMTPEVKA
jgi:DNA-binding transcriptional ArsR family regulator